MTPDPPTTPGPTPEPPPGTKTIETVAPEERRAEARTVEELPPVVVPVIGTAADLPPSGTVAYTRGAAPNVVMQVVNPIVAILVRAINLFLVTWFGLVTAAISPAGSAILFNGDFVQMLGTCARLAAVPTFLGVVKDSITVFGKLEGKFPLASGSV